MHQDDEDYYNANVKAVVYINADNSITVKFTGFEDKEHSAIFTTKIGVTFSLTTNIF